MWLILNNLLVRCLLLLSFGKAHARLPILASLFIIALLSTPLVAETVPAGVNLAALHEWVIVVGADAIESERFAAEEFQRYYKRASGIKLPIVDEAGDADGHIFIGPSATMRQSDVGFDVESFGQEDLRIIVRDANIAIAGGRPRGTLYGVYTFLEDYLGVRFLTPDHTHVPHVEIGERSPRSTAFTTHSSISGGLPTKRITRSPSMPPDCGSTRLGCLPARSLVKIGPTQASLAAAHRRRQSATVLLLSFLPPSMPRSIRNTIACFTESGWRVLNRAKMAMTSNGEVFPMACSLACRILTCYRSLPTAY